MNVVLLTLALTVMPVDGESSHFPPSGEASLVDGPSAAGSAAWVAEWTLQATTELRNERGPALIPAGLFAHRDSTLCSLQRPTTNKDFSGDCWCCGLAALTVLRVQSPAVSARVSFHAAASDEQSTTRVSDSRDPVFRLTIGAYTVSQATDLYFTGRCLEAQTCSEGNPILRWADDSAWFPIVKYGVAAGTIYALLKFRDKSKPFYRDPAWYAAVALTGGQVYLSKRAHDLWQEARR